MGYKIIYTKEAEQDLVNIHRYIVIEEEKAVAVVRIMYGGRNIEAQLSQ